ncbi:2-dehydropantoate 2-reductase [Sulfitobacter sp. JB4-11]|uniref:2-dehydropantoate 2-reductase n=1 Tax=Sulfitobacter rhodophyticola TaxID=3238304 RepID=UPI0035183163
MNLVVLGSGAIGCWVGASWNTGVRAAGGNVTLIGRDATLEALNNAPLRLSEQGAAERTEDALTLTTDPAALAGADVIVLAMKSHALTAAMAQIEAHARADAVLICLLNGIAPVRDLRARFPDRKVVAGMVPFNVVWTAPTHLHRTGTGQIAVERHRVTEWLSKSGADIALHDDLTPLQHGKLLLNLVNAVNALAGVPLYQMLADRGYRRVFAASLAEALAVYDKGGIDWAQVGPNSPRMAYRMLRAPNWLFRWAVLRRQGLDRRSMTSMAADVQAGRPTEIDTINGEITRLGALHGVPTPINQCLVDLIRAVEQGARPPALSAEALQREVGL